MLTTGNYGSTMNGGTIRRVTRGEMLLNKLVKSGSLTDAGKDFLIAAVDPMHDKVLKHLEGFPDVECAPSVVRCIKQTATISSGGKDLYIVLWPWLQPQDFSQTTSETGRVNNLLANKDAVTLVFGGLQIFSVPAGTDFDLTTATLVKTIKLDETFSGGASRLLGMGFEVRDVTAELYKQGTITCWRQPESTLALPETWNVAMACVPSATVNAGFSVHKIRRPPSSTSEAMLLTGSRQWSSDMGCYMVSPMAGDRNPVQLVNYVTPIIESATADESIVSPNTSQVLFQNFQLGASAGAQFPCATPNKIYPFHQIGCALTGTSTEGNGSSYTIQLNVYVESFPTGDDKDIVVMATPSAGYDSTALALYSEILSELPVAVPVDENGLGDWFADVISSVADYFTPIATAFNPLAGAAVGAAGAAAKTYVTKRDLQQKVEQERQANRKIIKKEVKRDVKQKIQQKQNNKNMKKN